MPPKNQRQNPLQVYLIKDILEYKVQNGEQLVLIVWENYSLQEASWQPIQSLKQNDMKRVNIWIESLKQSYRLKIQQEQRKKQEQKKRKKKEQENKKGKQRSKSFSKVIKQQGYSIKVSKNAGKDEKPKQNVYNSQKVSQNQVPISKKIQQQPKIIKNKKQENFQGFNNKGGINKTKQITKSQKNKNKGRSFRKTQQMLPQMEVKTQTINTTLRYLPVTRILKKINVEGKEVFQLQLRSNGDVSSGIYLDSAYISQFWPRLLADFEQNQNQNELNMDEEKQQC